MTYNSDYPDEISMPQSEENEDNERESWVPEEEYYPGDQNKTECIRKEWFERRRESDPYLYPKDVPTLEALEEKLEELRNSPNGRSLLDIALEAQRLSVCDPTSSSSQLVRDKE